MRDIVTTRLGANRWSATLMEHVAGRSTEGRTETGATQLEAIICVLYGRDHVADVRLNGAPVSGGQRSGSVRVSYRCTAPRRPGHWRTTIFRWLSDRRAEALTLDVTTATDHVLAGVPGIPTRSFARAQVRRWQRAHRALNRMTATAPGTVPS